MKVFLAAHGIKSGDNLSTQDKVLAILEAVVVTFLLTFIPKMLVLGRPPISIEEIWEPLLTSVLMALYTYMRMRGIKPEKIHE
ncbi:hypothetical protein ES702_03861 [subsurface metagenome]